MLRQPERLGETLDLLTRRGIEDRVDAGLNDDQGLVRLLRKHTPEVGYSALRDGDIASRVSNGATLLLPRCVAEIPSEYLRSHVMEKQNGATAQWVGVVRRHEDDRSFDATNLLKDEPLCGRVERPHGGGSTIRESLVARSSAAAIEHDNVSRKATCRPL